MKEYRITIRYYRENEDHWQSQWSHRLLLRNLGIEKIRWSSGCSVPKNWNGYTEENPSPGYDIDTHDWIIECDSDTVLLLMLKGIKVEELAITAA